MKRIKDIKTKILLTLGYFLCVTILNIVGVSCLFKTVFNIPCIGCGMTRAWISALSFDFASAFHYHAMFWAAPILYLYFLFDGRLIKNKRLNKLIFIGIAIGFFASWIINLCNIIQK